MEQILPNCYSHELSTYHVAKPSSLLQARTYCPADTSFLLDLRVEDSLTVASQRYWAVLLLAHPTATTSTKTALYLCKSKGFPHGILFDSISWDRKQSYNSTVGEVRAREVKQLV